MRFETKKRFCLTCGSRVERQTYCSELCVTKAKMLSWALHNDGCVCSSCVGRTMMTEKQGASTILGWCYGSRSAAVVVSPNVVAPCVPQGWLVQVSNSSAKHYYSTEGEALIYARKFLINTVGNFR